jgi:hypothetical protein
MKMPKKDLEETFAFLVRTFKKDHPKLAYLHLTQPRIAGIIDKKAEDGENLDFLVRLLLFGRLFGVGSTLLTLLIPSSSSTSGRPCPSFSRVVTRQSRR